MEADPANNLVSSNLVTAFQELSTSLHRKEDQASLDLEHEEDVGCSFDLQKSNLIDRRRAKSLPVSAEQACLLENCAKRVQFADMLGLDLANIKHFSATDDPHVPSTVMSRLKSNSLDEQKGNVAGLSETFLSSTKFFRLKPTFAMPIDSNNFVERLHQRQLVLEKVSVSNYDVHGVIRVMKTDCEKKEVGVRHTFNDWMTFVDTKAVLEGHNSLQDLWESFVFTLYIPPYISPEFSVQFAVYYLTDKGDFWDNNEGQNYILRWDNT